MSRKSERLVNLVIALLATRRSLTKSEIFRTIDGYDGSEESMERMFERDKDELRSLGIEIEVSGLDPLFDDELGYRIRPENFAMDAKGYSTIEIALKRTCAAFRIVAGTIYPQEPPGSSYSGPLRQNSENYSYSPP